MCLLAGEVPQMTVQKAFTGCSKMLDAKQVRNNIQLGLYCMGFLSIWILIHGFHVAFLHPGGAVELYFLVLVELYTVSSDLKNLANNPTLYSKIWPQI